MDLLPNARTLPVVQASPIGHARAATQFFRQHLPRNPAPEDKQNTRKAAAVR